MDQAGGEAKSAGPMSIRISITVTRLADSNPDLASMLGNLFFDFFQLVGLPQHTSSKANLLVTDMVADVMQRQDHVAQALHVNIQIDGDEVLVNVAKPVDPEADKHRFPRLTSKEDPQTLLTDVVRQRRISRSRGGLGLVRSRAEAEAKVGKSKKKPPNGGSSGSGSSSPPRTI